MAGRGKGGPVRLDEKQRRALRDVPGEGARARGQSMQKRIGLALVLVDGEGKSLAYPSRV